MTNLNIYDFNKTITQLSTFAQHYLTTGDWEWEDAVKQAYEDGKFNAMTNIKEGLRELFKHDDMQISAIATYHNNPAFIAGTVAALLGKELCYKREMDIRIHDSKITVNEYHVESTKKPFLIAYIKEVGEKYLQYKNQIVKAGKNAHIIFLRTILLTQGVINEDSVINFYDDLKENYEKAERYLSKVNSFLVDAANTCFSTSQPPLITAVVQEKEMTNEEDFPVSKKRRIDLDQAVNLSATLTTGQFIPATSIHSVSFFQAATQKVSSPEETGTAIHPALHNFAIKINSLYSNQPQILYHAMSIFLRLLLAIKEEGAQNPLEAAYISDILKVLVYYSKQGEEEFATIVNCIQENSSLIDSIPISDIEWVNQKLREGDSLEDCFPEQKTETTSLTVV